MGQEGLRVGVDYGGGDLGSVVATEGAGGVCVYKAVRTILGSIYVPSVREINV